MDSFQFQSGSGGSNGYSNAPMINPPTLYDDLDDDDYGGGYGYEAGTNDDQNDAKRRRIARACDMCRKKKIKCDGKTPSCSHCINYSTECIFTHVEKKRNPPKGAKYIEGLENRLGRMEALLKLSGVINEEDGDRADLQTLERRLVDKSRSQSKPDSPSKSPSGSTSQQSGPSVGLSPQADKIPIPISRGNSPDPTKQKEREEEVESLSDMMCSLVTNNCGETRYIGSSSGFSIFSPKGIQWVNEKTGDSSFQEMISHAAVDDTRWVHWRPEIFSDVFTRRVYQPLPPRDEAFSLLRDFFDNFNSMFPLFHEPTFMHLVQRHYSRNPYEGSGWWASLNVALAIAHRLRIMSNLIPKEDDKPGWGYLKNAMGVLTELTMRNTDLLSVQALLGMALYLMGTPNPQPSFFLVAAAIRLSHSIGLHKKGSAFGLNAAEMEQRKRVFWIAYILDKDICLRSGRPPAQDDDDMTVELPNEDPPDDVGNIPLNNGEGKANLFRLMCNFAMIENKVYKLLYSAKASKQSDGLLLNTIGELDKELEDWKDSIPIDFRPEHEIKASHAPLVLHIVVLHFAYYNCLATIHRMSVHHGYWSSRLSNFAISGLNARPLNPRVFSSAALCVQAARASIHLIKHIPQNDFACVWLVLYFPVSSLVTLFANVLQNPTDARARSDVKLMNQVVNFLSLLSVTEEQGGVKRMLGVCAEFERIAKVVLEKSDNESRSRKRKGKSATPSETPPPQQRSGSQQSARSSTPQKRPHPPTPIQARMPTPNQQTYTPSFSGDISMRSNTTPSGFTPGPLSDGDLAIPMDFGDGVLPDLGTSGALAGNTPQSMQGLFEQSTGMDEFGMGSLFHQSFVPQDLWQMPMSLDWDWADAAGSGNGLPGGATVNGQGSQLDGNGATSQMDGIGQQDGDDTR